MTSAFTIFDLGPVSGERFLILDCQRSGFNRGRRQPQRGEPFTFEDADFAPLEGDLMNDAQASSRRGRIYPSTTIDAVAYRLLCSGGFPPPGLCVETPLRLFRHLMVNGCFGPSAAS